ncbi:DUF3592 domain-containing protein [Kitasatospora sp. NA04385]|uniref:DUF3592 domain-containing protein n=1 Tax=Kitasatospora sp. NA04385 TaxID=2742135 RepID=UPI001590C9B8|nr:DUF3592 domain-containing protein [Kitasatospora sp. NA04385]QKW23598.1 DUF3592 domain-containing protein [Kitasatospora sp. NA04385]
MLFFDVLAVVWLVLAGFLVLLGCATAVYVFRLHRWERRALRKGSRVPARCVEVQREPLRYSKPHPKNHHPPAPKFLLEYAGPDGAPQRFRTTRLPEETAVGDELTVAYHPERPEVGVLVAGRKRTALTDTARVLGGFLLFLLVAAAIAAAGAAFLHGLGEEIAHGEPTWAEF